MSMPWTPTAMGCWQQQVFNAGIGPDLHQSTTNGGVHWGMAWPARAPAGGGGGPEGVRPCMIPSRAARPGCGQRRNCGSSR